jgi:hypothetical protein
MGPLLPIEAHRHLVVFEETKDHTIFAKIGSAAFEDQLIAKETQTIGGLLLHIEMRPDVEDSEDAPWATVVDLLNSDEPIPMGLSDLQIVELLKWKLRRMTSPSCTPWGAQHDVILE